MPNKLSNLLPWVEFSAQTHGGKEVNMNIGELFWTIKAKYRYWRGMKMLSGDYTVEDVEKKFKIGKYKLEYMINKINRAIQNIEEKNVPKEKATIEYNFELPNEEGITPDMFYGIKAKFNKDVAQDTCNVIYSY